MDGIFLVLDAKTIADGALIGLQADMPYIAGSVVARIKDKLKRPAICWPLIVKLKNQPN